MSQHNRVVWAEGLFLRPQHFQQAERYFERLMSQRLDSLAPYAAGFTRLQIDQELLKIGKVGLVAITHNRKRGPRILANATSAAQKKSPGGRGWGGNYAVR